MSKIMSFEGWHFKICPQAASSLTRQVRCSFFPGCARRRAGVLTGTESVGLERDYIICRQAACGRFVVTYPSIVWTKCRVHGYVARSNQVTHAVPSFGVRRFFEKNPNGCHLLSTCCSRTAPRWRIVHAVFFF